MTTFATLEDAWGVSAFGKAPLSYGAGSRDTIPVRRHPAQPVAAAKSPRITMLAAPDRELKQGLRRSVLEVRERHGIAGVARLLGPDLVWELCASADGGGGGGGGWWDLETLLTDPEMLLRLLVAAFAVLVIADLLK